MDNDMMGFAAHTERLDRITNEIRSNAERGVTRSSVSVPDSISSSDIEYIRRSLARSGIDASLDLDEWITDTERRQPRPTRAGSCRGDAGCNIFHI